MTNNPSVTRNSAPSGGLTSSRSKVRKAVLPAAGLGTRFLPATKAQPKEMLTVVDKPQIQYVAEECVASGIEHIIIVTGRGKSSIEDHFDASPFLEDFLEKHGKKQQAKLVRDIADMVQVSYTRQKEPLGLGHAVRRERATVHRPNAHLGARARPLGLHLRRHLVRRWRQTRLPESHRGTRAAKPGARQRFPRLPENAETVNANAADLLFLTRFL